MAHHDRSLLFLTLRTGPLDVVPALLAGVVHTRVRHGRLERLTQAGDLGVVVHRLRHHHLRTVGGHPHVRPCLVALVVMRPIVMIPAVYIGAIDFWEASDICLGDLDGREVQMVKLVDLACYVILVSVFLAHRLFFIPHEALRRRLLKRAYG